MFMKKLEYAIKLILLSFILLVFGCSKDETKINNEDNVVDSNGNMAAISQLQQGKLVVKISEDLAGKIEEMGSAIKTLSITVKSSNVINDLGVTRMERIFPYAGKFEERTRKRGMHLWYEMEFDQNCSITKAVGDITSIDGIESVEFIPKISIVGNPVASPFGNDILAGVKGNTSSSQNLPFDDPDLHSQWHYYNDGTAKSSIEGCDINVFPVWENYTKGDSKVIVSVVDGGVDYSHEDLNANMWKNPEETGNRVYGWNFIKNGPLVTADDHGTHVAGTIAAVNNNGLGVCGIAGGDYKKGIQGALIMSCQIFDDTDKQGNGATAIKWGADHGAVISQNSWGYDEIDYTPEFMKDAVDYFIDYAGYDENGNQVGPMAGGVVIFAAGNNDKGEGYPASYEPIIAVSSVGADFQRAYYSNYGDWTDITAPGADAKKGNLVISTLPGNKYGGMQGTSMACPHVSGIAALIVSYMGGPGFTNTMLRNVLEKSCIDISSYNKSKKIAGLIDAQKAISSLSTIPPDKITDLAFDHKGNTIEYSFSVPKDEDDNCATGAIIYYAKDADNIPDNCSKIAVPFKGLKTGDKFYGEIGNVDFDATYFIAAVATDMAGNKSEISEIKSIEIPANLPPVIKSLDGTNVSFKASQTKVLRFEITEPEGQSYTYSFNPVITGTSVTVSNDNIMTLTVVGPTVAKDMDLNIDHNINTVLTVTDEYNASSSVDLSFVLLKNNPPVVVKDIEDMIMGKVGEVINLDMSKYFYDEDGEQLKFSFSSTPSNIVALNQNSNKVFVTAMSFGMSDVTVTATDALGKTVSSSFKVLVRDSSSELDLYPQPATSYFYLRTGNDFTGVVKLYNSLGSKVLEQSVNGSAFNPAKVDISNLSAGTYTMALSLGDKEIKRNFVKL